MSFLLPDSYTKIWLFKTNPKYYTHVMKPQEGGAIQQYIQNNSNVCVNYKPGDIALVWLTGDKKHQLIHSYYIIKNIETKTYTCDVVIEELNDTGHVVRYLDTDRKEAVKTFEKRKQNSLQVLLPNGNEVLDTSLAQADIVGKQLRLLWRRLNRLVYGEQLHFFSTPFHLDGYNQNAFRLYREIKPEHRHYVIQMMFVSPNQPGRALPLPSTPQQNATPSTPKMAIQDILGGSQDNIPTTTTTTTSSDEIYSHELQSQISFSEHTHIPQGTAPEQDSISHEDLQDLVHQQGSVHQQVHEPTTPAKGEGLVMDNENEGMTHVTPSMLVDLLPITPTSASSSTLSAPSSLEKRKRKRTSAKERVAELMEELSQLKERTQKLESENFYLKYNILMSQQMLPIPNPHLATVVQNMQLPASFPVDFINNNHHHNNSNNNNNNINNNNEERDTTDEKEKKKKLKAADFVGVCGGDVFWVAKIIKKVDDARTIVQWYEEHPHYPGWYYEAVGQDEIDTTDIFCSGFSMQKGETADLSRKEYEDGEYSNHKRHKSNTQKRHHSDDTTKVQLWKPSTDLSTIYIPKEKDEDEEMRDDNTNNIDTK